MMRLFLALVATSFWFAPSLAAEEPAERLMRAMHLHETMVILAQEGRVQGQNLEDTLLEGVSGDYFTSQVADMYDPDWMRAQITKSVADRMSDSQIEQAAIFFESDLGQSIVSLENSARQAMVDDAIDEMARQSYSQVDREGPFFRLVDEYVQVNDLVAQNTRIAFNSDYAFIRGLASGREEFADKEWLLGNLLTSDEQTRKETETWVYSFLLLAYQPLSETQMRGNIAFSRTDAGRALNKSLFEAYDRMMVEITFNLGAAVVHALQASDL